MAVFNVKKVFDDKIKPRYNFDFDLKNEQISVIESVLEKNHTVGVFPTGFGKSICFLLPPLILDQKQPELRHICLVISPLKSLMLDQCKKNSEHGIAAAVVKSRSEMSPDVAEGMILFIAIQIEIYAKMCHLLQQCILILCFYRHKERRIFSPVYVTRDITGYGVVGTSHPSF